MQRAMVGLAMAFVASAAGAQTQNSTTTCNAVGGFLNCNTTTTTQPSITTQTPAPGIDWNAYNQRQQEINRQNQENMNRSMQNLGAAIAADRERRRLKRQAEEYARKRAEINAALAQDNEPAPPPPEGVTPVRLRCTIGDGSNQQTGTVALYEPLNRADVTDDNGLTRARAATFTEDTVSWTGSVWRASISRLDMSITLIGVIPAVIDVRLNGTCQLAERQF